MTNGDRSSAVMAEIARLDAMGDDDSTINLDDIPEITPAQWASAIRAVDMPSALVVEPATIRYFRAAAPGDYRAEMNAILRRAMLRRRRRAARATVSG